MGIAELLILAVGLSMDAMAVSICKGLAMKKATIRAGVTCGLWFGGFQALMPLIGFFLGALLGSLKVARYVVILCYHSFKLFRISSLVGVHGYAIIPELLF